MRFIPKAPWRWRKAFAWLPVKIGSQWIWMEHYWWADEVLYRRVALFHEVTPEMVMKSAMPPEVRAHLAKENGHD
jgi:hypothetical protein